MEKEVWIFGFLFKHKTIKIMFLLAIVFSMFATMAVFIPDKEPKPVYYSNGITSVVVISDSTVEFSKGRQDEVIIVIGRLKHTIRPVFEENYLEVERILYESGADISNQLVYAPCINPQSGIGMECNIYGNIITFRIDFETVNRQISGD